MSLQNGSAKAGFGLIIDNTDVRTSEVFAVTDPITGNAIHSAPAATKEQAIQAIASAERAFEEWRDTTPIQRRDILMKATRVLEDRKDELVRAMVIETGAKPSWAAFNISTAIQFVIEGAAAVTQVKGELVRSNDQGTFVSNLVPGSGSRADTP